MVETYALDALRWLLLAGICVGLTAPVASVALAGTAVPVFARTFRRPDADTVQSPRAARMLVDGSLMVVTVDGPGVTALRYDISGATLSSATFYPPVNSVRRVAVDGFGALAVIGRADTNNGDFWVMKYDGHTGRAVWPSPAQYNQGGSSFDDPVDVAFDGLGNVVVAGWSQAASGSYSLVTFKYSGTTGTVKWGPAMTYLGLRGEAVALTLDPWGNVIVTGKMGSPTYDWVTVKYSGVSGGTVWGPRTLAGTGNLDDVPVAISTDASGNVIVTGSSVVAGGSGGIVSFATIKYDAQYGNAMWGPVYFNSGGIATATPKALLVDTQGNVVVTGAFGGTTTDFATLKYSGATGAVVWGPVYFGGAAYQSDSPVAIAADGAGRVYVTGTSRNSSNDDIATVAYDATSGSLLFGPSIFEGSGGGADVPFSLVVEPQGSLLVTGTSTTSPTGTDLVTLRYGASGSLIWGPVSFSGAAGISDRPVASAVDASGNLLLLLRSSNGRNDDIATVKFDGSTGGLLWGPIVFDRGGHELPAGLALDGSGDVVVTGASVNASGNYDYATLKYSGATGAPLWGPVLVDGGASDVPVAVALDPQGNAVVTGTAYSGATRRDDMVTVKYDGATGNVLWGPRALDVSNGSEKAVALVLDAAGDVIVGGSAYVGNDEDMVVAKYGGASGVLAWGPVTLRGGSSRTDRATALALDSSGNVFVTGYSMSGFASDYASFKLSASGAVQWGPVLYNSGSEEDVARAAAADGAGNLVVTGRTSQAGQGYNITTMKYASATGGLLWGPVHYNGPWTSNDEPAALVLDAAGNVVIAGYSFDPSRRSADATLIKYAGSTGAQLWDPVVYDAFRNEKALTLARLGDDVVIAAGSFVNIADESPSTILVRYTERLGLTTLPGDIPPAGCGNPYSKTLVAANGSGTYFFSIVSGSLPPGLILTSAGALSGTPSALGSFPFRVRVDDGETAVERDFNVEVYEGAEGVAISVSRNPVCAGGTTTLSAPGGFASYVWYPEGGAESSLTVSPSQPTTYGVVAVDSTGCTRRGAVVVGQTPNTLAPPTVTPSGPTAFCDGGSVTLTSSAGTSYLWSNGATTRSITVATTGSYEVTVTNAAGCAASSGVTNVTVVPNPLAVIAAPSVVCAGSTGHEASVPDAGAGATYSWTIGNGTIISGAGTPVVVFAAGPIGPVSLAVAIQNEGGCSASGSQSVAVSASPSASVSAPASVCAASAGNVASVLDAGPGATYAWTVSNGTVTAGAGTRAITFTAGSMGPVSLAVSVVDAGGCSASGSQNVAVSAPPSASISAPASACAASAGRVASVPDAGAGATYTWTVSNGTVTAGAGTRAITFTAGLTGPVSLEVTVVDAAGCSASGSQTVDVSAPPTASISAPASICAASAGNVASVPDAGVGATYTWTVSNGTVTAGAGTRTITFTAGSTGPVSLAVTVVDAASCSASGSQNVEVSAPPSVSITAPTAVCARSSGNAASVQDAGPGATYAWTISNATLTAGIGTRAITFTADSTGPVSLTVTVVDAAGCSASSSQSVAVSAPPSPSIGAPASVCAGSTGNGASVPDAGAGATYSWTVSNGTVTAGAGTRAITFTAGSSGPVGLAVTVVDAAGCSASGSQSVPVSAPPSASINAPVSVCADSTGNAASVPDAGAGATYSWTVSNGTVTAGAGTRAITFTAGATGPVSLAVTVVDAAGCSESGSQSVAVSAPPSASISAPASVCAASAGNAASVPDAGAGATYAWTVLNGTVTAGAGTRSITFTAGSTGPVSLAVTVRNAAGCSASGAQSVNVGAPPSASISAPASVCADSTGNGASVPDAGAGATYTWTVSNATVTSGGGTRAITFTAGSTGPVSLAVTVQNAAGCSASGSQSATVSARPSATITAPSSLKKGSYATASVPNAGVGATYAWTISNGTITAGGGTRSITFRAGSRGTLRLTVTVTSSSGCTATGSRNVTVN